YRASAAWPAAGIGRHILFDPQEQVLGAAPAGGSLVMPMPLLKVERLSKSFGTHEVLRNIDLSVEAGEVMCIVGPSGSGKSTLLRCLNYLETPDSGAVFLTGEPIGVKWRGAMLYEMSFNELAVQRQRMGMVFQSFNLFPHKTALENIIEAPIVVKRKKK